MHARTTRIPATVLCLQIRSVRCGVVARKTQDEELIELARERQVLYDMRQPKPKTKYLFGLVVVIGDRQASVSLHVMCRQKREGLLRCT